MTLLRWTFVIAISILLQTGIASAQWTVSTLVAGPAGFDDGISLDASGNLYISHYDGSTVKKVTPDGTISTYVSGLQSPNSTTMSSDGTLYIPNATGGRITRVASDGTVNQTFATGIHNPAGVVLNPAQDTLYVSQYQRSRIIRFPLADPSNHELFASGGQLNGPVGMAFAPNGSLLVGNFNDGRIVQVASDGSMSTLASIPQWMGAMTVSGSNVYATSFSTHRIYHISMDGTVDQIAGSTTPGSVDGPGLDARFSGPNGIAASVTGDTLYVSEYTTRSVRMMVRSTATSRSATPELPGSSIFPNPFRSTVTIPGSAVESTRIFDIMGRLVATLPASGTSTVWDAGDVRPGLYFIQQGARSTPVIKLP